MSDSRLEKFIYAICSMDVSDLPVPLSRIEKLWNCLITGETPDFEPLSRNEKYLMAMLDRYDISNLPAPMSRGEKLLYKIAVGETDLSDVPGYLSRYEELLKYLIENGGISGGDFEYVLYTLNQSLHTLYLTAEKPVKSAILKGQTLVNKMVNATYRGNQNDLHPNSNKEFINTSGLARNILPVATSVFEPNKTYTIILFLDEIEDGGLDMTHTFAGKNATLKIGANKTLYTTPSRLDDNIYSHNTQIQCNFKARYMVLDGDYTNVDIPYFTGMQSVKMPVLTTTGKNLFDGNQPPEQLSWGDNVKKANVKENTTYVYSSSSYKGYVSFKFYDNNDNEIGQGISINSGTSFTTPPNTSYLKTHTDNDSLVQIEEGTQATPYEPYKSNILTVNKDVTLRSNGNVYDELDLLTGKLTQHIDEDGSVLTQEVVKTVDLTVVDQDNQPTELGTFENVTHVSLEAENLIPEVEMEVATRISTELASASPLMDDISTNQQQLNTTVNEQSNNVDATMIATTEIFEETL